MGCPQVLEWEVEVDGIRSDVLGANAHADEQERVITGQPAS